MLRPGQLLLQQAQRPIDGLTGGAQFAGDFRNRVTLQTPLEHLASQRQRTQEHFDLVHQHACVFRARLLIDDGQQPFLVWVVLFPTHVTDSGRLAPAPAACRARRGLVRSVPDG